MRACLEDDFEALYVVDLRRNVNKNPKISGTTHNVFGIKPGVCISFLLKRKNSSQTKSRIYYQSVDEFWRKEAKYQFLDQQPYFYQQSWRELKPDAKHTWLNEQMQEDYDDLIAVGDKQRTNSVFADFSLGVSTNRDDHVYGFDKSDV